MKTLQETRRLLSPQFLQKLGLIPGMCLHVPPRCIGEELRSLQIPHYCLLVLFNEMFTYLYSKTYFCYLQLVVIACSNENL